MQRKPSRGSSRERSQHQAVAKDLPSEFRIKAKQELDQRLSQDVETLRAIHKELEAMILFTEMRLQNHRQSVLDDFGEAGYKVVTADAPKPGPEQLTACFAQLELHVKNRNANFHP